MTLIYSDRYRGWGKQKPAQWGQISTVRSAVLSYYEDKCGISAPLIYLPFWELAGGVLYNYGSADLFGINNAAWTNEGIDTELSGGYVATTPLLAITSKLSVLIRAKFNAIAQYSRIFEREYNNASSAPYVSFGIEGNSASSCNFMASTGTLADTAPYKVAATVPIGETCSVVGTFDSAVGRKIYVNGAYVASANTNLAAIQYYATDSPLDIGYQSSNGGNKTDMELYVAAIFAATLTPSQITLDNATPYAAIMPRSIPSYFFPSAGGGGDASDFLDGKVIILNSATAFLDGKASILSSATSLLDGKSSVLSSNTSLVDGKVSVLDSISTLLDGKTAIEDSATDSLDGKTSILSSISSILDGKARILDSVSCFLDGKVSVLDTTLELLDGKATIESSATTMLDGKVSVLSSLANLLDGKLEVISTGAETTLLDGKVQILDVFANILDGKAIILSSSSDLLDGKTLISSTFSATNLLDGKATIQDIALDLLDGKTLIRSTIINILDGKALIENSAASLLDGKALLLSSNTDILDGKTRVLDSNTSLFDGKVFIGSVEIGLLDGKAYIVDGDTALLDGKVFVISTQETILFDGRVRIARLATGEVTIAFTAKAPAISWSAKAPSITFN